MADNSRDSDSDVRELHRDIQFLKAELRDADARYKLPDGRNLAYRICGATANKSHTRLVFAFHGALGTGNFDLWSPLFQKLGWLVVSPTLPGWGMSSPNSGYTLQQYAEYDMMHLIQHIVETLLLGSSKEDQSFWCLGISYGCVHAIACAVHLPICRQVSGLCLLGPHGPFDDPSFNPLEGMALPSRMGLGCMGFYLPWLTRFTGKMVQKSVSTPAKARQFVQANLLDAMNEAEKKQFASAPEDLKDKIASGQGLHDSLCASIQGYVDIPSVLRSWSVEDLSKKVNCPTHVFVAQGDVQTPARGATFIHQKLLACGSKKKLTVFEEGGHMTLVFQFDACVEAFATWMSEQ
jgi:pimeloyl-ACP methyl ester carboxylesterase